MKFQFPKSFYWGAATSAHQVEGGNHNDWSEWEKKNAERLAKEAEKKFSHLKNWPDIKEQAQNSQNYISGRACDHYNRYEEDFDIAKSLGHNAHRFSIEWSRIEPEEGKFDEKEIEHYKNVIKALRARGLEPFVTLWHWTQPIWISDIGGWENKKTVDYFLRFVEKIVGELKEDVNPVRNKPLQAAVATPTAERISNGVKFWVVLNEPNIYTGFGFVKGSHPPGKRNIFRALKAYLNLLKAQKRSYEVIHKIDQSAEIGIANSFTHFEEKNNLFLNRIIKIIADYFWNFWFLDKIKEKMDFVGCNYYSRQLVGIGSKKVWTGEISDLGWEIFPQGIYFVLKKLEKYKKPIYITENGIADIKDGKRAEFIKDHLRWIGKAMEENADVRGYFHWSLLDNFEFPEARGFWPRFGLVEVNYKTMERKIRKSAYEYAEIIRALPKF